MSGSILGHPVRRTEDPRFLTGAARYTEDLPMEGLLHAVFVRSFMAHARIRGVDTALAASMPGVVGVYVAADLDLPPFPTTSSVPEAFARPMLASDVVRFAGEAVAVVVAETRALAFDAAEAVLVDYEPLPVAADPLRALAPGAPLLFPAHGSNVAREKEFVTNDEEEEAEAEGGRRVEGEVEEAVGAVPASDPASDVDPLEGAEVVVRGRFVNQRLAAVPMEPNGAMAAFDPETEGLTLWAPTQGPFFLREDVARELGLKEDQVRVIAPAVGGGFGAKIDSYPEQIVVSALAHRLRRPVRYVETRSENLMAMHQGRGQIQDVEIGALRDGTIVGLRVDVIADAGAYPIAAYLPGLTRLMSPGVYRIPQVRFRWRYVVTNTTPIAAYRGAGRPEAAALIERAMDMVADELGMDPVEVRRKNLIPRDAFPYRTAGGADYDVGDYEAALAEALQLAGHDDLRKRQAEQRARGERILLGIGVSTYVEITGWGSEFGSVQVHTDGSVTVLTGVSPHGQGHETAFAQIVAGTLGIPMEDVTVVHSDTGLVPRGGGTMGSRSLQKGGSAVYRASEQVLEKARRVAARVMEVAVEDVVLHEDGRIGVAGVPDRSISWAEVATAAQSGDASDGLEPGLSAGVDFDEGGEQNTFPFGAHIAVVEVDMETGLIRLVRHVAVDDCGRILNPMLVDGQVHGGVAQGAAQALFEEVRFDENGTPLTANLTAYAMPSAAELPTIETAHTETPTPLNPLGAKGIGESGTIGSTPAVQNAVIDALSHLGVRHVDMPLSPERVWQAIRDARRRAETE